MSGEDVTRVARIALPDGTPVWARISGAGELSAPSGRLSYSDTGFAERVEASVESLHALVTGVARSLAEPLRAVRPDEVSVEFGIELTAKAGKVVGLLADGEAKAGITVTLTWNSGPPDLGAPQAGTTAGTDARTTGGATAGTNVGATAGNDPRARDGFSVQASTAPAPPASPPPPPPVSPPSPVPPPPPTSPPPVSSASTTAPAAPASCDAPASSGADGGRRAGASPGAPMHRGADGAVGGGGA
ncbi:hypothetical protein QF032_005218 [Streptomyces achromogenes]|uniref:CU044_2847 family protein n=1 Tax=Streptomyces achromogenes TaxID=67255 RepID=UPI002784C1A2|nr:hypothetical protein [Streptomyces achromogenes]